jgi:GNAT superfamily N-acetyltransferase
MMSFRQIVDVEDPGFQGAMWIYRSSFPANERHPASSIAERLAMRRYWLFIEEADHKAVFMAILYPIRGTDFILLDYMATAEGFRNQGIGSAFLRYALDLLKARSSNEQLFLEVENPACGDNREQRQRRVGFYRRLGTKVLEGVRYVLPPLSGDQPTEMVLMVFPKPGLERLPGTVVRELILRVYHELYCRDEADPFLKSFIPNVPDTVNLI